MKYLVIGFLALTAANAQARDLFRCVQLTQAGETTFVDRVESDGLSLRYELYDSVFGRSEEWDDRDSYGPVSRRELGPVLIFNASNDEGDRLEVRIDRDTTLKGAKYWRSGSKVHAGVIQLNGRTPKSAVCELLSQ